MDPAYFVKFPVSFQPVVSCST